MKSRSFSTRIIAYKKGDHYLGVALDFDLMVQSESLEQALYELKSCIESYLITCVQENESDEDIYRVATKKYQNLHGLFVELQMKNERSKGHIENYLGTLSYNQKELANV